jgi:hypothetical protein
VAVFIFSIVLSVVDPLHIPVYFKSLYQFLQKACLYLTVFASTLGSIWGIDAVAISNLLTVMMSEGLHLKRKKPICLGFF